jgi:hypothetical protein
MYNLHQGNPGRNMERQFVELTASSYEYCYNNPVRFSDPTGEQAPPDDQQGIKAEDIPTEKISKPGLLEGGFKTFIGEAHQLQVQAFASSRQEQPNVAGVAMFDHDDYNTIVITYSKYTAITVDSDGNNVESTEYKATYSIFRADKNLWDRNRLDLSEKEFFDSDLKTLFSDPVLQGPGFSGGGKAMGIAQAAMKFSKQRIAQHIAKYGIKSYEKLKKVSKGSGFDTITFLKNGLPED